MGLLDNMLDAPLDNETNMLYHLRRLMLEPPRLVLASWAWTPVFTVCIKEWLIAYPDDMVHRGLS